MNEWDEVEVGDLCSIKHGYAFKGEFFEDAGHFLVLSPGNFRAPGGLQIRDGKETFYSGEFSDEYLLDEGDLVIAMTDLKQDAPILGSVLRIPEPGRFLHNQRLGLVQDVADEVDLDFLYYLLNDQSVRWWLRATATGSTVRHTAPERIYRAKVRLPPIAAQEAIGASLRALDDLVENNRRRIEILEGMARLLYREWFVHFRYPGHEDVESVDSDLGPIPQDWSQTRLAKACSLVMGQSPKSKYYNDVGEGLPFHQGVSDFGRRYPTHTRWTTVDKRVAEPGDILFSVRAPVGRINVAPDRLVVGRGLSALRALDGHQNFLLIQLKDQFSVEDSIGGGTIFNAVTKKDMESIMLLNPPSSVVEEFESVASPLAELVANLSRQNVVLREARDLLLPRLVSGDLDVSELGLDLVAVGL